MNIVYFANHNVGCRCLEALVSEGLAPGLVITQQEEPEHLSYDSVEVTAKNLRIAVHVYDPTRKERLVSRLEQMAPDVLISVAWRFIFPKAVLDIPRFAAINFHGSFLPRCRGANPTNWALISGEKQTGVTVHFIDQGIDTGDIIIQEKFPILPEDTAYSVRLRQDALSVVLMHTLAGYLRQGDLPRTLQNNDLATTFRKRRPEDGLIRWDRMSATQVFDFVRALTEPYPGAFAFHNGRKLILWKVLPVMKTITLAPGTIFADNGRPCVACSEGFVMVLEHGPQGEAFPRQGSLLDGI
jgi:UDP-4-amino-4-deoxy-L-arabinose formyltransferase/UDP-glucuronic acid dehydrogenase (UDP-4-keto-hexauronic acid decarboxylating)